MAEMAEVTEKLQKICRIPIDLRKLDRHFIEKWQKRTTEKL